MKRRTFLSSLTAAAVGGTALTYPSDTTEATEKHADISIFMTDAVQEATATSDDPYFATNLIGNALKHTLPTIPGEDQSLTLTIRTETTVIDENALNPDPDNPVYDWKANLDALVPSDEKAADTNLLLTDHTANIAGQGNVHCGDPTRCAPEENTAAIVMTAGKYISELSADDATGPWNLNTPEFIVQVAVHEAGHTLGLTHSHGTGEDGDPAVVTPMLGTYIFNDKYAGAENRYNEQLPDMTGTDAAVCRAEFNPRITLDDLTTAQSS